METLFTVTFLFIGLVLIYSFIKLISALLEAFDIRFDEPLNVELNKDGFNPYRTYIFEFKKSKSSKKYNIQSTLIHDTVYNARNEYQYDTIFPTNSTKTYTIDFEQNTIVGCYNKILGLPIGELSKLESIMSEKEFKVNKQIMDNFNHELARLLKIYWKIPMIEYDYIIRARNKDLEEKAVDKYIHKDKVVYRIPRTDKHIKICKFWNRFGYVCKYIFLAMTGILSLILIIPVILNEYQNQQQNH